MSDAADFEALLRQALRPVEPPERHRRAASRATLVDLTELAADELEAWELSAMRDPRNWARPRGRRRGRRPPRAPRWCCCAPASAAAARGRHGVLDAAEQALQGRLRRGAQAPPEALIG